MSPTPNLDLFLKNYADNFGEAFILDNIRALIDAELEEEGAGFLRSVLGELRELYSLTEGCDNDAFFREVIAQSIFDKLNHVFKKVIFLDIDGVMVRSSDSLDNWKPYEKLFPFSSTCVESLNHILRKSKATIVLSSSWRLAFDYDEIKTIFRQNGVITFPVDITKPTGNDDRSVEIQEFVAENMVKNYVILDDSDFGFKKENFVLIDPIKGLSDQYFAKISKILNNGF